MSGNNGCPNDENDYEIGVREERARIVAFCRMCAANNAAPLGHLPIPAVKAQSELDARRFAFIADSIERCDHLSWQSSK